MVRGGAGHSHTETACALVANPWLWQPPVRRSSESATCQGGLFRFLGPFTVIERVALHEIQRRDHAMEKRTEHAGKVPPSLYSSGCHTRHAPEGFTHQPPNLRMIALMSSVAVASPVAAKTLGRCRHRGGVGDVLSSRYGLPQPTVRPPLRCIDANVNTSPCTSSP
jgi:hypothetical protein